MIRAICYFFLSFTLLFTITNSQESSPKSSDNFNLDSLIGIMTLEEKVGQLMQYSWGMLSESEFTNQIRKGQVGSILNLTGADETKNMQKIAVEESRLGIPLIFGLDVIHGYRTIFPIPLGEAASWDLKAIEQSARIAATEASAAGVHWTFAPMVDIARDPRWGRVMEGAGEDPYLGAQVAAARVKGFQGDDLKANNTILACAKHFAAYGAVLAGRDYNTVDLSELTLREIYLPPFKAAVEAGVGSIMTAFNDLNGIPVTGSRYLITDILKNEWNFKGFVVSDWNSIAEMITHGFAENNTEAAYLARHAGVDMDMMSFIFNKELPKLIQANRIIEEQINDAVKRILIMKDKLGLFENPYKYCNRQKEKELLLHEKHLAIARDMAKKSIVLLKNEKKVLPLSKDIESIAVIGPLANNTEDLIAEWSARGRDREAIPLLAGIKSKVSEKTKILYAQGCNINDQDKSKFRQALKMARKAKVILVAVGESKMMSGEALCRAYLDLPGVQTELLQELIKLKKPMVVVLMNGRPLVLNWMKNNLSTIIETWLLGTQAGNAIADVLFGDYNPSGKLPISFPYAEGQIPVFYNYKNTGRPRFQSNIRWNSHYIDIPNEPLFPFGYGLSYTTFAYSNIKLSKKTINQSDTLRASIEVTNTGNLAGSEVVQLYIRDLVASVTRPVKELKGFAKISLKPGETKKVDFSLYPDDLKFFNQHMEYISEPGDFILFIGTNSIDTKEIGFKLQ